MNNFLFIFLLVLVGNFKSFGFLNFAFRKTFSVKHGTNQALTVANNYGEIKIPSFDPSMYWDLNRVAFSVRIILINYINL